MAATAQHTADAGAPDWRLSVAPMMERTDRHLRRLLRVITRHTRLYTEMVAAASLHHGDAARWLAHDPDEHPLAAQIGGGDPVLLARGARHCHDHGFDEVNLNVGCPSPRVSAGSFGACLMLEPRRVADCVAAMRAAQPLPVTVKTRIGVDQHDEFEDLLGFVDTVAAAGCTTFVIHARKAWLHGLSPRANREVPPLDYPRVARLKRLRPDLRIVLNGGLRDLDAALDALGKVDGAMIGRAACDDPFLFADADRRVFGARHPPVTRAAVVEAYLGHVERETAAGVSGHALVRPLMGLYHGRPGARRWRRALGEAVRGGRLEPRSIIDALAAVEQSDDRR